MRQFTAAMTDDRAELLKGEPFGILLAETPATGFRWQIIADGEPVVRMTGETFQPSAGVGGQGVRCWQFLAVKPGESEISMALRRSWETGSAPAQAFTLRIVVKV